jgi:cobalt-zinc-cadmium efflux system outer membrane protein
MRIHCNASMIIRRDGIGRAFHGLLFALIVTHNAPPFSVARAQEDDQARQDRRSSVAQPRQPERPEGQGLVVPVSRAPSEGLTLDQAVARMERENLTLAAMWLEVPQARADVLSARQQPNSLLLISNGKDGPVRLRPLELIPKRWARAFAAGLAARVTEAQYRDAVRTRTADLYAAYVDVQEAQMQAQFARASLGGVEELTNVTKLLTESAQVGKTDLGRVAATRARAALAATDAEVALRQAKLTLAELLNIPIAEAERLEIKAESEDREPSLPTLPELTQLALAHRPDLRAHRLGLSRAQAELLRTWLELWPDVYVLAGPNRRAGQNAGDGAIALRRVSGLLVSFPDSGHHRGKISRAQINVAQSRIELARVERQVVVDVWQAHLEYTHSLAGRRRLKEEVLPSAKGVFDDALKLFREGEADFRACRSAQSEYNQVVSDCLKASIRYRRGALALNTAVGKRALP